MAKAVQSHPPSPSPKHETTRSRNSIEKWYIIWGLDNGKGKITYIEGDTIVENYEGEFKGGQYNGLGVLIDRHGEVFGGEFRSGKIFN